MYTILLAAALVLAAVLLVGRAAGQAGVPTHVLIARVCANESARVLRPAHDGGGTDGVPDADCLGVVQTIRAFARWKGISSEQAIRRLAPYVTATKPAVNPRHAVYATLPAYGAKRPALWVDTEHGPWAVYGWRWERLREAVDALVYWGENPQQCNGNPIAWGGSMDDHIAIKRGLVRLACGPTQNSFWALPSTRSLPAAAASGQKHRVR